MTWDEIVASLPDPERDPLPPRVGFTAEGLAQAKEDRAFKRALLDTKRDTERLAKYILEGHLFNGSFRKDGDWMTLASGQQVYQKKVSDLVGSVPYPSRPNAMCYVEAKGVSPGESFSFSRLDRSNNCRQPSQHEKLTWQWERGDLVWLFIGWWDSREKPIVVERGERQVRKWYKEGAEMTGTLLRWDDWLEIYRTHKRRSIGQKDRRILDDYCIYKVGNRWLLADNHWWIACL